MLQATSYEWLRCDWRGKILFISVQEDDYGTQVFDLYRASVVEMYCRCYVNVLQVLQMNRISVVNLPFK